MPTLVAKGGCAVLPCAGVVIVAGVHAASPSAGAAWLSRSGCLCVLGVFGWDSSKRGLLIVLGMLNWDSCGVCTVPPKCCSCLVGMAGGGYAVSPGLGTVWLDAASPGFGMAWLGWQEVSMQYPQAPELPV